MARIMDRLSQFCNILSQNVAITRRDVRAPKSQNLSKSLIVKAMRDPSPVARPLPLVEAMGVERPIGGDHGDPNALTTWNRWTTNDLPGRFLEAFAAILAHSNYAPVLDAACRVSTRCGRCAVDLPGLPGQRRRRGTSPAPRSELLLKVYRRYFTPGGALQARLGGRLRRSTRPTSTTMAEEFYRCTACRRCKLECPMGIDHGLITHLGRWILAEIGIVPKALLVATREQLEGKTRNTSAIPRAGPDGHLRVPRGGLRRRATG